MMKRKMNRAVSILLCMVMLLGVLTAATLSAGAADPYSVNGTCGKTTESDIQWYAFNDRSMVFFGKGAMKDYALDKSGFSTAPWFSADMSIVANTIFSTKIVIESGITAVGDYAFYLNATYNQYVKMFMTISSIDLSDTVTSIGKYAFYKQEIENINIPPSVKHIGTHAFGQCAKLTDINYYGDPSQLVWDHEGTEAELSRQVTCHILKASYEGQEAAFNTQFANVGLTFVADLENPYEYAGEEEQIDRNIALYYGATNSGVFAGAVPYIVVGTFDGNKKSTTYGSRGFVSCVKIGSDYYLLTDTNGTLKKVVFDTANNGRAASCSTVYSGLKLKIRHEYIGSDIVKVIYTLQNDSGNDISNIRLGGSGDIKIGADDRAAIKPLYQNDTQLGFYMSSSNDYDKSGSEYATLGFIADNISKDGGGFYPDTSFFYGSVGGSASSAAAGIMDSKVFPQRIFEKNTNSYSDQAIAAGTDVCMSYYWDGENHNGITLNSGASQEFALLYSVYGNSGNGQAMIDDLTTEHYTVTWENYDHTILQKQSIKLNDAPVYTGLTPEKPYDHENLYEFSGWKAVGSDTVYGVGDALPPVTGNITYTAQYNPIGRPFFVGYSLTLRGDIGVNFYVDPTTIEGVGMTQDGGIVGCGTITLDFRWFDKHDTYTIQPFEDYDSEKQLFKTTCRVAAAEMMYPITATVYVDGVKQQDVRFTKHYRVRDYADVILDPSSEFSTALNHENHTQYENLQSLIKSMLDYGAKAQITFDRFRDTNGETIELANTGVDYAMTEHEIDAGDAPDMTTGLSACGLEYKGSTLVFRTTTNMRHYYRITNQSAFDAVKDSVTYTLYGETESDPITYTVNGTYIFYEVPDIKAANLDQPQKLTIGAHDYLYSPMQLAQKMQQQRVTPEDYNLATALYWYNDAAKTYYNNL